MGKFTKYSFLPLACLGLCAQSESVQALPTELQIRLPSEFPGVDQSIGESSLLPELLTSQTGNSLALDFSVCDTDYQCLNGQISTEYLTSAGQAKLQQHQAGGAPITLAPDVQGFLLSQASESPTAAATSVMWQQDEQFYTVYLTEDLPAAKRQEALYLAHSVANSSPMTWQHLQEKMEAQQVAVLAAEAAELETPNVVPVRIDSVEVSSDLHLAADIETLIEPMISSAGDRSITSEELALVANTISQQYQSQGFLTSSAVVTADDIASELQSTNTLVIGRGTTSGIIVQEDTIAPAEVSVSDVDEDPLPPGAAHYIQSRLSLALKEDEPVHFDRLEDQLRLLREDPLFDNVEANLTSLSSRDFFEDFSDDLTEDLPEQNGRPRLVVRATQAEPFAMGVRLDNGSPVSTGGEQATVAMSQRNLFRFGDQLSSSYNISSTAGIRKYAFGYQVPLNAMNGSLRIGVESTTSKVTQAPFDTLGIRGNSQRYSLNLRQPLVRSPREELALSLGFSHSRGQTFLFNDLAQPFGFGPDLDGRSQVSTLTFGQQYLVRDEAGAWSFNSEFNLGVDWLGATVNEAPVPDGRFFSWLGQAQRSQRLGDNHLLVMQADMQLTPDSLLPSEQFVVGGVGSVRGYRQNLRSGDNGVRFSVEDRVAVVRDSAGRPEVFVTPFLEAGTVWQSGDNPNQLPEQNLLLGTGIGLLWENAFTLPDFNLRVDYGLPLIQLTDRGNNLQDSAIHFSVDYEI